MLKKLLVHSVSFLLLFSINGYAVEKADWISRSQELLAISEINFKLENRPFNHEKMTEEVNDFWENASAEERQKAYEDIEKTIPELKARNEALINEAIEYEKKPPVEKKFIEIAKEYDEMNESYRNALESKRSLNGLFEKNPYYQHRYNVFTRLDEVERFEDKTTIYIRALDELNTIKQQLDNISHQDAVEIKNIGQYLEQNNVQAVEIKRLKEEVEPVITELKALDKKMNNYIDDAYLNCNASPIDFSCHSRCEVSKIDPIFGTYKTDYDYNCINRCENQESNAQNSLDDEVTECINDKQHAIDKLERLDEQRTRLFSRGKRLEQTINSHEQDLSDIVKKWRSAIQIYEKLRADSTNEISTSLIDIL